MYSDNFTGFWTCFLNYTVPLCSLFVFMLVITGEFILSNFSQLSNLLKPTLVISTPQKFLYSCTLTILLGPKIASVNYSKRSLKYFLKKCMYCNKLLLRKGFLYLWSKTLLRCWKLIPVTSAFWSFLYLCALPISQGPEFASI